MSINAIHNIAHHLLSLTDELPHAECLEQLEQCINGLDQVRRNMKPDTFLQYAQDAERISAQLEQIANSAIPDLDKALPLIEQGQVALSGCNRRINEIKQRWNEINQES